MVKSKKQPPEQMTPTNPPNIFNNALIPISLVKIIAEKAYQAGYEGDLDSKSLDCLSIIQSTLEAAGDNSFAIISQEVSGKLPSGPASKLSKEMQEIMHQMENPNHLPNNL